MKKILIGGLTGGVANFLLGWLFYGILFKEMMMSGGGTASGVYKTDSEIIFLPLIIGNFAFGFMLSVVFSWSKHYGLMSGLFMGAVLGLLSSCGFDMIMYGTANIMSMKGTVMDIVIGTILTTLAGGAVGWAMGMIKDDSA